MNKRKAVWLVAASCAVTLTATTGLVPVLSDGLWLAPQGPPTGQTACIRSRAPLQADARTLYPNFRALVHQIRPAVVEVLAESGDSIGSGFIVRADGIVLTSALGIGEARSVVVRLDDRREFEATVLGVDAPTDVAVLRIHAAGLTTARLADASPVEVGDPVLAVAAALGGEGSVSQGIVGAKIRTFTGALAVPLIQTDAVLGAGGTGGPLLDGLGAVVGMTVGAGARTDYPAGAARALPIQMALKVARQIEATGRAVHPRLGVAVKDMNAPLARTVGLEQPQGAFVIDVSADGSAARAGLAQGDVVIAVDASCVVHVGDLSDRLALALPGDTVRLQVWRHRSAQPLSVVLGTAVGDLAEGPIAPSLAPMGSLDPPLESARVGMHRYGHVSRDFLAASVAGLRARIGLLPGDVLLAINGVPVNSIAQAQRVMLDHPRAVEVLVKRKGARILVPLELI